LSIDEFFNNIIRPDACVSTFSGITRLPFLKSKLLVLASGLPIDKYKHISSTIEAETPKERIYKYFT